MDSGRRLLLALLLLLVAAFCLGGANRPDADVPFEDAPVQLLMPDKQHKNLVVVEEGLKVLSAIEGDVAVIGVVGPFHSGKSFLMNRLLGRSKAFRVGPTVDPTTRGLWMWGKPMPLTIHGRNVSVLFLDTEGFFSSSVSEEYDAKLFSVTTLLSSYLLYNSVKMVDAAALDYLELLARRTQLFGLKAALKNVDNDGDKREGARMAGGSLAADLEGALQFPPLMWVVEDFFQDTKGLTPTQWLHSLLQGDKREHSEELQPRGLKDIFPSLECHTVFLPAATKEQLRQLDMVKDSDLSEEYKQDMEELRRKVFSSITPKQLRDGSVVNGAGLAGLLRLYVHSVNAGEFPIVPSVWDGFLELQSRTAHDDALSHYQKLGQEMFHRVATGSPLAKDYGPRLPIPKEQFKQLHREAESKTTLLYKNFLFGLTELVESGLPTLKERIEELRITFEKENNERLRELCTRVATNQRNKHQGNGRNLPIPIPSIRLQATLMGMQNLALEEFTNILSNFASDENYGVALDNLKRDIEGEESKLKLKNSEAISREFDKADKAMLETYITEMDKLIGNKPHSQENLSHFHHQSSKDAWKAFRDACAPFDQEKDFSIREAAAHTKLRAEWEAYEKQNEKRIEQVIKQQYDDLWKAADRTLKPMYVEMPVEEEYIQRNVNAALKHALEQYTAAVSEYHRSPWFETFKTKLMEKVTSFGEELEKRNIEATKRLVGESLDAARKIIEAGAPSYWFEFTFKRWAREVAEEELQKKVPSPSLRSKVAANFVDNDLARELNQIKMWPKVLIVIAFVAVIVLSMGMTRPRPHLKKA
ncbi:Guanylate-binding protein, N-terminal domain [Balamuthia mandrillaris]